MKEIDGKQFPTVWSELFTTLTGIGDKVDSEPTLQVKEVADWLEEYKNLSDSPSGHVLDSLAKRGNVLHSYLVAVTARVSHMLKTEDKDSRLHKSKTMTEFKPADNEKAPSEAARERLVLGNEDYQVYLASLTHLETMEAYCKDMCKSLRSAIDHVRDWKKQLISEQPRLPG